MQHQVRVPEAHSSTMLRSCLHASAVAPHSLQLAAAAAAADAGSSGALSWLRAAGNVYCFISRVSRSDVSSAGTPLQLSVQCSNNVQVERADQRMCIQSTTNAPTAVWILSGCGMWAVGCPLPFPCIGEAVASIQCDLHVRSSIGVTLSILIRCSLQHIALYNVSQHGSMTHISATQISAQQPPSRSCIHGRAQAASTAAHHKPCAPSHCGMLIHI